MYFVALYWLKYDPEQILNSTDSFTLTFLQQMEQITEERKLKKTVWSKFYHSIFCESRVSRQIRSLLLLLLISSIGCKKTGNVFQVPWEILFFLHLVLMIEKKKMSEIKFIWYDIGAGNLIHKQQEWEENIFFAQRVVYSKM